MSYTTTSGDKLHEINNTIPTDVLTSAMGEGWEDTAKLYYSQSGVVQLIDTNTDDILWEKGDWTTFGTNKFNEAEQKKVINAISTDTVNAFKAAGGNSNKYLLPNWMFDENKIGKDNTITDQEASELGIFNPTYVYDGPIEDNVENLQSAEEYQDKLDNPSYQTITTLMAHSGGSLNYPTDALYTKNQNTGFNQDHVRIMQYEYQPPRKNLVQGDAVSIMTQGVQRTSPLKRYLGMCKLPMPTDISDSNNVSWGEDTMNNLSAAMTSLVGRNLTTSAIAAAAGSASGALLGMGDAGTGVAADALRKLGFGGVGDIANSDAGRRLAGTALQSRLLAAAGFQVSPEDILARGFGIIPNANLELLFNSPNLREFQFSWKMTPRDEQEGQRVRNIIRFFKQGMAARKRNSTAGAPSIFLGTPNVFHVQYKTNQEIDIASLNRIKTVACTGCAVNYTPDGIWSAYEDGVPVSTVMSLRFQELEPIYDTDYKNSVPEGLEFNQFPKDAGGEGGGHLYPIDLNEVGY